MNPTNFFSRQLNGEGHEHTGGPPTWAFPQSTRPKLAMATFSRIEARNSYLYYQCLSHIASLVERPDPVGLPPSVSASGSIHTGESNSCPPESLQPSLLGSLQYPLDTAHGLGLVEK